MKPSFTWLSIKLFGGNVKDKLGRLRARGRLAWMKGVLVFKTTDR